MGWFFGSSNATPSESQAPTSQIKADPSPASEPRAEALPNRAPKTRDEVAEEEFQAFLKEFNEQSASSIPSQDQPHDDRISPFPTSMHCTTMFDAAWHCQLFGGQFINVYRYGGLRDCSDAWSRFWFCMRTNRAYMSDERRQERVERYYREREKRLLRGPNSEDVWEARSDKIQDAFDD